VVTSRSSAAAFSTHSLDRADVGGKPLAHALGFYRHLLQTGVEDCLVVMFPLERRDCGDVYVKTGTLQGHPVFIVKVSPWFAANVERDDTQGGFIGVFDSQTGHTIALRRTGLLSDGSSVR
jgi:hypothetical protein